MNGFQELSHSELFQVNGGKKRDDNIVWRFMRVVWHTITDPDGIRRQQRPAAQKSYEAYDIRSDWGRQP